MHTRHLITIVLLAAGVMTATAQSNGSNSSYSRFGLGLLADQSQGYNRSMGGVGQGLRSGNRINKLNPASYSAVDSLSFLFDVGMGLQRTRMKQGGTHQAANNTSFDYVIAGYRLRKSLGMAVGFVPYTNIGYTFSHTTEVTKDPLLSQDVTQTQSFSGSGGLHEAFLGLGWQPVMGLSVGFNAGFLWGDIEHITAQSFSEGGVESSNYSSLATYYNAALRTWRADIGVQYRRILNSTNRLTVGATVGIGHKIGNPATLVRISQDGDTATLSASKAFQLPMTYSLGVGWEWSERLLVAADVTMEQWKNCTTPQVRYEGAEMKYVAAEGEYLNRWRVAAGAEYVPGRYDASYLRRINYRFGMSYSTPYLKVNGLDGPSELNVTAGVGLPIFNVSSRSFVNVGVQWTYRHASAASLITENVIRLNLGLTFHEAWFMKRRFR